MIFLIIVRPARDHLFKASFLVGFGVKTMFRSTLLSSDRPPSGSHTQFDDLSAQLAPLNLYGLAGLGSALVDGLLALTHSRATPHRDSRRSAGE
jgi:hypothetical protein